MGSIWVSDQIPNCLLETAFNNINLSLTVTHMNLPAIEGYLKTSLVIFYCLVEYEKIYMSKAVKYSVNI